MSEATKPLDGKHVYRVEGFSCANCAGKFEKNVQQLPGVKDAKVNFGASKLTVYGKATVEELEQAGAFENLKVTPEKPLRHHISENKSKETAEFFYQKYSTLLYSGLFLVFGYLSLFVNGEKNLITTLLFAAAIVIGGHQLFRVGLQNLIQLDFDMRTLMTVALIGAAIIGEWAEGAVVVILFALSEALERYSMERARRSIRSLMELAPKEAVIRRRNQTMTIPVDQIAIGDTMIVKPGEKIAMDGIVIRGKSSVNQATITGESLPVEKTIDDEVFAGTLNEEGLLEVKVTKLAEDTTISKIIHLVEEAQGERAPAQAFIDKFAKYYTPIIMLIAAMVAILPPLFDGDWTKWVYQGLSVLVVGCPCALVISTPVSIVSAIGNAAKHGVLIKGGIYLEEMGRLQAIAFDKTGTLTKGSPAVTDLRVWDTKKSEKEILSLLAALESGSSHPLASAIIKKAEQENLSYTDHTVKDFRSLTGKGIRGTIDGVNYYLGSPKLGKELSISFDQEQSKQIKELQSEGKTVLILSTDQRLLAIIAVSDQVRETSKKVVEKLYQLGIRKTMLLTGDNRETAEAIGKLVDISEIESELMPEEKLKAIKQLRSQHNHVAMVGDGVNDAPALAAANVGVAMGSAGTDTALETADVALMGDDLNKLPFTIQLSRKTLIIIKQNIFFAIAIKLIALLLVVPGWLTLWIAIASDLGATLLVTLNGFRLMGFRE